MKRLLGCAALLLLQALAGCDLDVVIGHAVDTRDAGFANDTARPQVTPRVQWLSGVHRGNDLQTFLDFGSWRGRPIDFVHVYTDRTQGWDGLVTPGWPLDMLDSFQGQLVISEPLYPDTIGDNHDCAAGMYDAEWRKLGTFLLERQRGDAIVRLGWGFNDMKHASRADADPSDWIACFRHVVNAIRSTDAQLRIDWSFNQLGAPNVAKDDPFAAYPGDAYVDFVGIEAFDMYPPARDQRAWDAKCQTTTGLCHVIEFARDHGKKLGIAEWGVASCGGDPGGDNPFFIDEMLGTFAANLDVMGYEAYFEDAGSDVCSTLMDADTPNPKASARYKQIYGQR